MATTTLPATRSAAPPATVTRPVLAAVQPQVNRWGAATMAAALLSAAMVMAIAGLSGAFLLTRSAARTWPPKGVHLDNYRAITVVLTALMASAFIQWAVRSARQDDRRNAVVSSAMAAGFGIAVINLVWFTLVRAGFGAATPYGGLWFGLVGTFLGLGIVGVIGLLVATARAVTGQLHPEDHQTVTAAAVLWHTVTFLWVCIYLAVWVLK